MENIKKLILEKKSVLPKDEIFDSLARDALCGFGVDLVSIWLFNNDQSTLTCVLSKDQIGRNDLSGTILQESDYPAYFSTLMEGVSIRANNVYTNPATRDMGEKYYRKYGILSTLDYVIYAGDEPVGIVSCNTTKEQKAWSGEDINYLRVLTVMAGAELKSSEN